MDQKPDLWTEPIQLIWIKSFNLETANRFP